MDVPMLDEDEYRLVVSKHGQKELAAWLTASSGFMALCCVNMSG
jgi:hypothetical protein